MNPRPDELIDGIAFTVIVACILWTWVLVEGRKSPRDPEDPS